MNWPNLCEHQWEVQSVSHTMPILVMGKITCEGQTAFNAIREVLEGVTHVYLKCSRCGDFKENRMFGIMPPESVSKVGHKEKET